MIKSKLLILLVIGGLVGLFVLSATMTGTKHHGTNVKNVELVKENNKLVTENEQLTTENKKLNAVVDSQATVINETTAQLQELTKVDEPVKKPTPRNDFEGDGERYSLQPIDLPNDENN